MTDAKYDEDGTLVDADGEATTPLHEAMAEAVDEAIAHPFKPTPRRGLAGEELDEPTPQPQGGASGGSDDEDSPYDSGNDVAISSGGTNSDVSDIYDTRKASAPVVPGNIFQQYASTANARDAAERFTPKTFVRNGTSEPDNRSPQQGVRTSDVNPAHDQTTDVTPDGFPKAVAAGRAELDTNADRILGAQIRETTHAGGAGVAALQAQRAALLAPVLGVRSPMPTVVRLDPLSRTPTPLP